MFYSAAEFTEMLEHVGFRDVSAKSLLGGMIGFHKARKP
jgi:demethylmenaquinone methyltransferase/2-methoxy-6-polyprenyl-1,4-benzoquinol methylase